MGTPGLTPLGIPGKRFLYISCRLATAFVFSSGFAMETPLTPAVIAGLPPEELLRLRIRTEMDQRLRPLTDNEIDAIIPAEG